MKTVAIIGVGLIGGSLGMALKLKKYKVVGIGRNLDKLKLAKQCKAIDEYTTDIKEGVRKSEIIVLSTPVDVILQLTKELVPHVNETSIITDVGSTKYEITKLIRRLKLRNFVPGHPLAGSEKQGVRYATPHMFENAKVILTPIEFTNEICVKEIEKMWKTVGADVMVMSAKKHDELIARTSHLPHIISAALINYLSKKGIHVIKNLAAGSLKDLTRISESDPSLWSSICSYNAENINKSIDEFLNELKNVKKRLSNKKIYDYLKTAKEKRELLVYGKMCKSITADT